MAELETLYKSSTYWVVNKPIRVHFDETLTQSDGDPWEAVHRLDFETSGALLFARPHAVAPARAMFKSQALGLQKIYLAGATQPLKPSVDLESLQLGWIAQRYRHSRTVRWVTHTQDLPRGWRNPVAVTQRVQRASGAARDAAKSFRGELYEVELHTGARHQIRSFFASAQAPLVGDEVYGAPEGSPRLELHAWKLSFEDPLAAGTWVRAEAPLP